MSSTAIPSNTYDLLVSTKVDWDNETSVHYAFFGCKSNKSGVDSGSDALDKYLEYMRCSAKQITAALHLCSTSKDCDAEAARWDINIDRLGRRLSEGDIFTMISHNSTYDQLCHEALSTNSNIPDFATVEFR